MKRLTFADRIFEAESIVKMKDSIVGYTGNKIVFEFRGVSVFSSFELADGQEFDLAEQSVEEKLRLEMARSNAEMFETMLSLLGGR
ncbi:MAG: hypothetical protein RR651_11505 [Lysinibacillus sp.]